MGGYFLFKTPDEIRVGDIIRAVDGETDYACCFATDSEMQQRCCISSRCVTAAAWRDISIRIDSILDGVTLRDVMNKGDLIGVPRACDANTTPTA
ncbi:MAG: DNA-binding IscR family transcriptional regulator [Flavobacteriales bacterium]|jgi:DNA-binding IscR family transcriptional regulator